TRNGKPVAMREWANELLEGMRHSAALLDQVHETDLHAQSLKAQAAKIKDVALTPSARILAALAAANQPFYVFGLKQSIAHQKWFAQQPLAPERLAQLEAASVESLRRQAEIEASDTV